MKNGVFVPVKYSSIPDNFIKDDIMAYIVSVFYDNYSINVLDNIIWKLPLKTLKILKDSIKMRNIA